LAESNEKGDAMSVPFFMPITPPSVGASLLAKNKRTPLGIWIYALTFTTIVGTPPEASPLLPVAWRSH